MPITWGPSTEYDSGDSNAVALDDQGHAVEVHVGTGRLFYRVGTADFTGQTITWGPSTEYDTGDSNAVALDDQGHVVEVHIGSRRLFWRVGTADFTGQTISWGPTVEYATVENDTGDSNAVALDDSGDVVEVHVASGRLFYRLGIADFTGRTITWGPGVEYDTGDSNAVALDDFSGVVEVHVGTDRLFYRVGDAEFELVDSGDGPITWAPGIEYDTGGPNAIAISRDPSGIGHAVEVHVGSGRLFYRVGTAASGPEITWAPGVEYDTGDSNAVALDDQGHVVEVHVGTGRLYYRVGTADFTTLVDVQLTPEHGH
jgi:hypothetical protein